jgi:AcrR family transcriptional regulator
MLEQPRTSQRAQQKADTRERIILAALKLFEKNGFSTTRTQEVADAAGISHGSIFAHFKTRDELILQVANHFLTEVDSVTRRCLRESTSLEQFLHAHLRALSQHEILYTRFIQEIHLLPKEVRSLLVEINSAVSSHLKTILGAQKESLGVKPSEYYFVFNAWMGVVTYYLLNRDLFTSGRKLLEERGNDIVQLFLKLITNQKGKKS